MKFELINKETNRTCVVDIDGGVIMNTYNGLDEPKENGLERFTVKVDAAGFRFNYDGKWYYAVGGKITESNDEDRSFT